MAPEISLRWQQLVDETLAGSVSAAARVCRLVDEQAPGHDALLSSLYAASKAACVLGVTGSPGVGKSTLVGRIIQHLRARGERVGVVAVDPSSPFTGGAILGDRIRMQQHAQDPEVFIRSLATRGALGGLSVSATDVARVLAAWGAATVVVETVGVGQDEADILALADTTLVVHAPGAGDDLQAAKAGLMECADVFVVNKSDLPGAERLVSQLQQAMALGWGMDAQQPTASGHRGQYAVPSAEAASSAESDSRWSPPVLSAVATQGAGIDEIFEVVAEHRQWLSSSSAGRQQRQRKFEQELALRLRHRLLQGLRVRGDELTAAAWRIAGGQADPYAEADHLRLRLGLP